MITVERQQPCGRDTDVFPPGKPSRDSLAAPVAMAAGLRELAISGLRRMYSAPDGLFGFRVRRGAGGRLVLEGVSWRYTAIALIGLAAEPESTQASVLGGESIARVSDRLACNVHGMNRVGDVALTLWACARSGYKARQRLVDRLVELEPDRAPMPTVELAWTLSAACAEQDSSIAGLRTRVARRLMAAFDKRSAMFPHVIGEGATALRAHVACFADLVYPVHALAWYAALTRDGAAAAVAMTAGRAICARQGDAGQWWWHYDRRTGDVIERYPVYAVHQDSMAPMALFALSDLGAHDVEAHVDAGLRWLARSPELRGGTLVDDEAEIIWRKVARREPGKTSRTLQALASRSSERRRVPGLDAVFPPRAIDYEDRPYHLGWVLYAWPEDRARRWDNADV